MARFVRGPGIFIRFYSLLFGFDTTAGDEAGATKLADEVLEIPPYQPVLFFHLCDFAEEFHKNVFRFVLVLFQFCSLLFAFCSLLFSASGLGSVSAASFSKRDC
jgi:hypothetical protein